MKVKKTDAVLNHSIKYSFKSAQSHQLNFDKESKGLEKNEQLIPLLNSLKEGLWTIKKRQHPNTPTRLIILELKNKE